MAKGINKSPVAESVPFDPANCDSITSDNIQGAIEDLCGVVNSNLGNAGPIQYYSNGNTANKWLAYVLSNKATDSIPFYSPFDFELYGFVFSNDNALVDIDLEFYVNGTLPIHKVFTWQIRGNKFARNTTTGSFFSVGIGDTLAVYAKKIGNSTAADVRLEMYTRVSSTVTGTGGIAT